MEAERVWMDLGTSWWNSGLREKTEMLNDTGEPSAHLLMK